MSAAEERVMTAGSNWLAELAARIRSEHEAVGSAVRSALDHAVAAGQMLIEAKSSLPHGGWLLWLRSHCKIPPRTASHYMRLAKRLPESARVADLTVTEALDLLAPPPPDLLDPLGLGPETRRCTPTGWPVVISACADCGVGTLTLGEWYLVRNEVWEKAWAARRKSWHSVVPGQQILCIGCLEQRLGRTLTHRDFPDGVTLNKGICGMSGRLRDRLYRGRRAPGSPPSATANMED
jgi:hypothetical protein